MDERDPSTRPLSVVFVCTGNRFRSPLLEAIVREEGAGLPLVTASAGTLELGPAAPLPEAVTLAAERGIDLSAHRACSLGRRPLREADLVVGFERAHIAAAVVDGGARFERSFGVVELVEALEAVPDVDDLDPASRARARIEAAGRTRPPPTTPWLGREIADPLGGPPEGYRRTADALDDLGRRLVAGLFGSRPRP